MSFKTTYWLFGILMLIMMILGFAIYLDPLPPDIDAFVFTSAQDKKNPLGPDKVVRVTIDRARPTKENIVLERDAKYDRWWIKGGLDIEADRTIIKHAVEDALKLQRGTKVALGTPDKHGLNPPEAVVTFELADGKSLTLRIGESTAGEKSGLTYVVSSDRAQVMAVRKSELEKLTRSESFFRERDTLASQSTNVLSVALAHTVEGKAKEPAVQLAKLKDRWVYEAPFKGDADNLATETKMEAGQPPKNITAVLDQINKLRIEYTDDKTNDYVATGVIDWAKYGLEATGDLLTIEVGRTELPNPTLPKDDTASGNLTSKPTLVVAVGKKADEKGEKYFARRGGEKVVFKIPAAPVNALLELVKNPDAARDRRLLTLDSERRVPNAMILKGPAGELEFYKRDRDRPWQLYRGTATKPSNLDENVVKGVLSLLGQDKMIESFPEITAAKEAELGVDKPTLVASFWVDGLADEKKEKKEGEETKIDLNAKPTLRSADKPTAKLSFGKRNREKKTVYVKREVPDEPAGLFEIRDVLFERLNEGPLAYLDRALPKFREGTTDAVSTVTKVSYTLKGKTTEISRAKDTDPWKVTLPKELEGRTADSNAVSLLLLSLNRLSATKYIAEKSTPTQLTNDYGLNPAAEKAEVTLVRDGKPLTFEFLFGKEAGEGGNLFGKFGGAFNDDTVFTIDRSTLNLFEREILDPTVFNFDPNRVKEVSLKGWNKGVTLNLVVTRKDDKTWEVQSSPDKEFILDSTKVTRLLNDLANLRAERFVSHGKGPELAHQLDIRRGALSIWLTLDGEAEQKKLLIGEADGQGYFATSPSLPNDVFLVSKATFEGPRSSIGHFGK